MLNPRPYVISIAGFDPSAGAGLLADVKCFEQHGVYGFGICSALTVQSDTEFLHNRWLSGSEIIGQLKPLVSKFTLKACKIGLIKDVDTLLDVLNYLKKEQSDIHVVMDPILKSTSGFEFHDWQNGLGKLLPVLKQLSVITPNYQELAVMGGFPQQEVAKSWANHCPVLLKGGHNLEIPGTDFLFMTGEKYTFPPGVTYVRQKHGSGCVLSASITALLALGYSLTEACEQAKKYTERFLNSNSSLLGYHSL